MVVADLRVPRWRLWTLGPRTAAYLVVWDLAAALLVAVALVRGRNGSWPVGVLLILAALAIGYDELSRRIENQRLGVAIGGHVSMRSVWAIVGAVSLPLPLFGVLAAVVYAHASLVGERDNVRVAPHRAVFNAATMVVSGAAADAVVTVAHSVVGRSVLGGAGPTLTRVVVVFGAALVYYLVNATAVAGALASVRGRLRREDLGTAADNLLELATLGLSAVTALAVSPWALLLVMPAMYLVQRSALVGELEAAATQDPKTGLLNSAAWHALAERELARGEAAHRGLALLVIDVDHFKAVNDRHGHLAGDRVLQGVAACLTGTLRDRDIVGRFGGEEFVALLPDLRVADGAAVAERVRATIASGSHTVAHDDGTPADITVTASIGIAALPDHGTGLTELLTAADAAMYLAKQGGRDRVAVAPHPATAG